MSSVLVEDLPANIQQCMEQSNITIEQFNQFCFLLTRFDASLVISDKELQTDYVIEPDTSNL